MFNEDIVKELHTEKFWVSLFTFTNKFRSNIWLCWYLTDVTVITVASCIAISEANTSPSVTNRTLTYFITVSSVRSVTAGFPCENTIYENQMENNFPLFSQLLSHLNRALGCEGLSIKNKKAVYVWIQKP